jgi:hypothetical protein
VSLTSFKLVVGSCQVPASCTAATTVVSTATATSYDKVINNASWYKASIARQKRACDVAVFDASNGH